VLVVQIQDIDLQIQDIITRDRGNLKIVYTMLPQDVRSKILETTAHLVDDVADNWIWNNCTSGAYLEKSTYSWLIDEETVPLLPRYSWNWVWKLKIPANIQFFIWQVMHLVIPKRTILNQRGILLDSICPVCDNEHGTLVHCLFNCNRAKVKWNLMVGPSFGLLEEDSSIFMWSHDSVDKLDIVLEIQNVFDDISMPLMTSLSKIKVMTHDVTQAFRYA